MSGGLPVRLTAVRLSFNKSYANNFSPRECDMMCDIVSVLADLSTTKIPYDRHGHRGSMFLL